MSESFVPLVHPSNGKWTPGVVRGLAIVDPTSQPDAEVEAESAAPTAEELETRLAELAELEEQRRLEHEAAMAEVRRIELALTDAEERMEGLVLEVAEQRSELVAEVRQGLASLVLAAARRIAGDGLKMDPSLLDALVEDGIRGFGESVLVLRVGSSDFERMEARFRGSEQVSVVEDPLIQAGCICEGRAGRIDSTAATAEETVAMVLRQWAAR